MARMHTTRIMGSQSEDEVDAEAITVRTPNLPPIVGEEEAPFPLVRPSPSVSTTQRIAAQQPLSLRAPASKEHESSWFDKEPALFVAPGVPEVAEPPSTSLGERRGFVAPSTRGVGFAMVALLLAGVVAAGSFFFLSSRSADEARVPDPTSTTQLTNAEAPAPPVVTPAVAPPPAASLATPETTSTAKPVITTVRTSDLPDSRLDRRKATTPATDPELRPDDSTKNNAENTVPTPSPDSPSTPPDLEEKR